MRDRVAGIALALIPLALVPCCWLWWWLGGYEPGVLLPGRSAALLLILGAVGAAVALAFRRTVPRAALPFILVLAWQAIALSLWAPVREPGMVWLVERVAALAGAIGLAVWLGREPGPGTAARPLPAWSIAGAALAGLGILALACLTQLSYHGGNVGQLLKVNVAAPFGLVNFNVGAAMPLCALGIAIFLHPDTWTGFQRWLLWPLPRLFRARAWAWFWRWRLWRWAAYALAALTAAVLLARGTCGNDPCFSVWPGIVAIVATGAILWLPSRWHLPLLAGAAGLALLGMGLAIGGAVDPAPIGAGAAHRVHIYRCALEALAGPHALCGYGPGAAIAVLPEQSAYAAAWLTVPSFLEHAHSEPLEVLLDGGLVGAALLLWGIWLTIRPLWARRGEVLPGALLVAWCTFGTHALFESHLSQPGAVLCLAILAGLSWTCAATVPVRRASAVAPALAALALTALVCWELVGDGGAPPEIETRTLDRIKAAGSDTAAVLAEIDRLRARLGPLDCLDRMRAIRLEQLGLHAEAAAAIASHLRRVPADAYSLGFAARLRLAGRTTPELAAAEAQARAQATVLLSTIHPTGRNNEALESLRLELDRRDDPDQDP